MKKIIFGIFAHPDDEAFGGPSGALIKEAKNGNELHLIIFTAGEAGVNPDGVPDLGAIRLEEWHTSSRLLGATSMHFLGFKDSQLDNRAMLEAAKKITSIVQEILEDRDEELEVEFMTMDMNGVTGHIDHIVAARTAGLVFYRLKANDSRFTRLRLACYPKTAFPTRNTDWIYMEAGRNENEIDEIIDAREYKEELMQIVRAHHSQRHDGENFLKWQGDNFGFSYFIVES